MTPDLDLSTAVWRKSRKSSTNGGCVEVANLGHAYALRDSKNPDGPVLVFTPEEWDCFLDGAEKGEFRQL
ncbi:DUF397 domain-containing protein [Solwaraspora sp. WMMB335]|uniref:DUF397 domain-containing protein n=1 Tax=Solwaraspora sp. WMMB335 TaxID=3404118 RepID=UPI003B92EB57